MSVFLSASSTMSPTRARIIGPGTICNKWERREEISNKYSRHASAALSLPLCVCWFTHVVERPELILETVGQLHHLELRGNDKGESE